MLGDLAALSNLLEESEKLNQQKANEQADSQKAAVGKKAANDSLFSQPIKKSAIGQEKIGGKLEENFSRGFKAPTINLVYKQKVTAEEVYGGFQGITPSTCDADTLVITLDVTGENPKDLDLNVTENALRLYGKIYRLYYELPHPVNENNVKASFSNGKLKVELKRLDVLPTY